MKYLHEIRNVGRDANPFFSFLDIGILSYGEGNAELEMNVRPQMMNGAGFMQGGLFVSLVDEAMALALLTVLPEGTRIATISESTSYYRGVKEGRITGKGSVIRAGRSVAFTEGTVHDGEGRALSRTTASFAIIPKA
jgi:uncharacterized protein (TIGR00369 family)